MFVQIILGLEVVYHSWEGILEIVIVIVIQFSLYSVIKPKMLCLQQKLWFNYFAVLGQIMIN